MGQLLLPRFRLQCRLDLVAAAPDVLRAFTKPFLVSFSGIVRLPGDVSSPPCPVSATVCPRAPPSAVACCDSGNVLLLRSGNSDEFLRRRADHHESTGRFVLVYSPSEGTDFVKEKKSDDVREGRSDCALSFSIVSYFIPLASKARTCLSAFNLESARSSCVLLSLSPTPRVQHKGNASMTAK